jgi:hypothetical protein
MNRRCAVGLLALAPAAAAQANKKFVGVWKLVSCESKDPASGEIRYPFGKKPIGRITYDAAGRMSAQLMNTERRKVGGAPTRGSRNVMRDATPEEMRSMLAGYMAYFGTYDVDENARTVIHHVQACLIPSWVGNDQRRLYEFSGDQLILTANFDGGSNRLVWQREPG